MIVVTPLLEQIWEAQQEAVKEEHQKSECIVVQISSLDHDSCRLMTLHCRVWVPYVGGLRQILMEEAQKSRFSIHPGTTKMYRDLRPDYWWPGMKCDIAW